jgi:hypothetical protein
MWGALSAPQWIVVGALCAPYILRRIPAVLIKSTARKQAGVNATAVH